MDRRTFLAGAVVAPTAGAAVRSSDVAAVLSVPGFSRQPAKTAAVDIARKRDPIVLFIDYLQ